MYGYTFEKPTDIKLIVLFAIKHLKDYADNAEITDILLHNKIVDYFDMQQCLDEMVKSGMVTAGLADGRHIYSNTKTGQDALEFFAERIPPTVRERLLYSARNRLKAKKNLLSVSAKHHRANELEHVAVCEITESGEPLFQMSVRLGAEETAKKACKIFKSNPQRVYSEVLRLLLDEEMSNSAGNQNKPV